MLKKWVVLSLLLIGSPFLVQCAMQKDFQSLDLRVRNMDNRLVKTEEELKTSQNALERSHKLLAQQGLLIDGLKSGMMQTHGKLDESSRTYQMLLEENKGLKAQLAGTVGEISGKMTALSQQVGQTATEVEEVKAARLREETERVMREAKAAEQAAAKAKEKAAAAKKGEAKSIEPAATKKKVKNTESSVQEAPAKPKQEATQKQQGAGGGGGVYDKALAQFQAKKFKEAHELFAKYLETSPKGDHAAEARYFLGESLFNRNEFELSILEYQRVIDESHGSAKAPAALLKQGQAFEKLNDVGTAKMVYYKLLDEFPKSDEAARAKKRLDTMQ